jgi:signal transduction histidine kinase
VNEAKAGSPVNGVAWPASRVAVVMVVGLLLAAGAHLMATYDKAVRDAEVLVAAIANSIDQTIGGSIRGVDSLLDEVQAAVQAGHHTNPDFRRDLLFRFLSFPELRYLAVADADGRLRAEVWQGGGMTSGGQDVSDQEYFLRQKATAGAVRMLVGKPTADPISGARSIHLTRPLHDALGTFAGVVVAAIDPGVYATFLASVQVDPGGVGAVFGTDGQMLAQPGERELSGEELARLSAGAATGVVAAAPNGVDMVLGYRTVARYPVIVACGVTRSRVLADWRRMAVLELILAAGFAVAMLVWARQIDHRRDLWRRHDADLDRAVTERTAELAKARQLAERTGERLADVNRELERLATVASHHLQEPIRSVVSFAQLAERHLGSRLDPGTAAQLGGIRADGIAMKRILGMFEQHVDALGPVCETAIDCGAVARQAADRVRAALPGALPEITIDSLPALSVPPGILREVFASLFTLAAGGRPASLTLGARLVGDAWQFRVAAPGLAAAVEGHRDAACWTMVDWLGGRMWTEVDAGGVSAALFTLVGWEAETGDLPAAADTAAAPGGPRFGSDLVARRIAVAMIVGLVSGTGLQLVSDREAALRAAETLTGAMVNAIEQHVGASIRSIDSLLSEVALAVEFGRDWTPEFSQRVQARLRAFPEVRMMGVVDREGRLLPEIWPAAGLPRPGATLVDPDTCRRQVNAKGPARLAVARPVAGPQFGGRTVPLTRPVHTGKDQPAALVVAAVDPDDYAELLAQLLLDEEGGSAVIGLDGRMLARAPAHEVKFGIDISDSDLFTRWLPSAPSGIAPLISKADGNDKFVGYKVVRGYPLVVTFAISRAKALHEWRRLARIEIGAVTAVSLVIFLWAWESDRQGRRLHERLLRVEGIVEERTADLAAANRVATDRARRLARVNEALRHLSRLAAHQLAAPARAIGSRVQSVSEPLAAAGSDAVGIIDVMRSASLHLTALIRDFRRYAAVCSEIPVLAPVAAHGVAETAALQLLMGTDPDEAVIDIADELPVVQADAAMLRDVFLQLFTNAVRHRGTVAKVTVRVTARREGDWWRFAVADDGPGISGDIAPRVLQAFEPVHGRAPGSTGLGLPLCRIIIQAHGGQIWLEAGGRGTTVCFTLPATQGPVPAPAMFADQPLSGAAPLATGS